MTPAEGAQWYLGHQLDESAEARRELCAGRVPSSWIPLLEQHALALCEGPDIETEMEAVRAAALRIQAAHVDAAGAGSGDTTSPATDSTPAPSVNASDAASGTSGQGSTMEPAGEAGVPSQASPATSPEPASTGQQADGPLITSGATVEPARDPKNKPGQATDILDDEELLLLVQQRLAMRAEAAREAERQRVEVLETAKREAEARAPRGIVFTNSERKATACWQYWLIWYGLCLRTESSAAARRGTVWHEAMDDLWAGDEDPYLTAQEDVANSDLEPDDKATMTRVLDRYWDRYKGELLETPLLATELQLSAEVPGCSGMLFSGRFDKVVCIDGRPWIPDHKYTSLDLDRWVSLNSYSPQLEAYAWLWRQHHDDVPGVLYDLVRSATPPVAADYPVNKDGTLSKRTPAFADVVGFREATSKAKPAPWYAEREKELEQQAGKVSFFKRHKIFLDEGMLARTGNELAVIGRRIREALEAIGPTLHKRLHCQGAEAVLEAYLQHRDHYPRNQSHCEYLPWPCPARPLCCATSDFEMQAVIREMHTCPSRHEELQES